MKVKEDSEKAGLKLSIQKAKIIASGPITSSQIDEQKVAPLSMGFSRQEYWSGLPFPSPGDLPDLGIKPRFPALQADSLPSEPQGSPKFQVNT